MTKEEAIKELKYSYNENITENEALDMAIRSLEQGTVTDFADKCRVCGAKYGTVNPLLDELEKALFEYDDTSFIKVKYIRQLLDKYKTGK